MSPQPKNQTSTGISSILSPRVRRGMLLALMLGVADAAVLAQNALPPDLMSYQGYLVDGNGTALGATVPVNYSIVFRIYSASSGGTALWAENQTVTVDKGNFSVVLGEGAAEGSELRPNLNTVFNSSTASDRYLGITVKGLGGNNNEIMPRLRLLTSPYSFLARTANSLVGSDGVSLISSESSALRISQPLQTSGGNARGANAVDLQVERTSSSPSQVASGANSVVVGGRRNTASQQGAIVVGGNNNVASGTWSFVGGGEWHTASGANSGILGGNSCEASGTMSFSMGRRAKAKHEGSFVYGDNADNDKSSTGNNQFLVYASGGMSINTTSADLGAATVTTLTASSTITGFGTIPVGGIIMWSGSTVPTGWALCDGTTSNGQQTPDLRGRFIVGSGAGSGLTSRSIGNTGGTETHTLATGNLPAHNHTFDVNTGSAGSHFHGYKDIYWMENGGSTSPLGQDIRGSGDTDGNNEAYETDRNTGSAGDHTHNVNGTTSSVGSGTAVNHLPPFYALAFIMRVQ
jgi:microcystin-dependent protein